jgi:uncharacterized protein YlxW (UPF0749 family)
VWWWGFGGVVVCSLQGLTRSTCFHSARKGLLKMKNKLEDALATVQETQATVKELQREKEEAQATVNELQREKEEAHRKIQALEAELAAKR